MKLTKIEPKYIKKHNPRVGLITLATDFRIEKDFNNVIYNKNIDLYPAAIVPEVQPYATQSNFWSGKISLVTSVMSSAIFFNVSFVSGL